MSEGAHFAYFQMRANTERELAKDSPTDYIARIHLDMASLYDVLATDRTLRHELKVVSDAQEAKSTGE